jgi:FAD-dependent urate hydroxylase
VAVIGAGNNGVESALLALRAEAASVELIVRSRVRWFVEREPHAPRGALRRRLYRIAYPVVGFGPPPINRFALHPDAFALLPHSFRAKLNARLLRPGAAPWLRRHVEGVIPIHEGVEVRSVDSRPDDLVLGLSDGTSREVDVCIVACGFAFSRDGLAVLAPDVRARVEIRDGWPVLDRAFRTTVPLLSLVGFPAEGRFGPLSRFVEGAEFAARRVAESLAA